MKCKYCRSNCEELEDEGKPVCFVFTAHGTETRICFEILYRENTEHPELEIQNFEIRYENILTR